MLAQPDAIRRPVVADLHAARTTISGFRSAPAQAPGVSALLLNNRNQVLGEPAWEAEGRPRTRWPRN